MVETPRQRAPAAVVRDSSLSGAAPTSQQQQSNDQSREGACIQASSSRCRQLQQGVSGPRQACAGGWSLHWVWTGPWTDITRCHSTSSIHSVLESAAASAAGSQKCVAIVTWAAAQQNNLRQFFQTVCGVPLDPRWVHTAFACNLIACPPCCVFTVPNVPA